MKKTIIFAIGIIMAATYLHFGLVLANPFGISGKFSVSLQTSAAYIIGNLVTVTGTISGTDTDALTLTDS
jgi:cytoskeletal protein CcmA (bactofilin family)